MPVKVLQSQTLDHFEKRLRLLAPDSPRRWGELTPIGLLSHLRAAFDGTIGENPRRFLGNFWTRHVVKWFALYVVPWPKGKVKAPREVVPPPTHEFEEERDLAIEAMRRFVAEAEANPGRVTVHFLFGPMPLSRWQRLHAKHLNHHLEQFGIH